MLTLLSLLIWVFSQERWRGVNSWLKMLQLRAASAPTYFARNILTNHWLLSFNLVIRLFYFYLIFLYWVLLFMILAFIAFFVNPVILLIHSPQIITLAWIYYVLKLEVANLVICIFTAVNCSKNAALSEVAQTLWPENVGEEVFIAAFLHKIDDCIRTIFVFILCKYLFIRSIYCRSDYYDFVFMNLTLSPFLRGLISKQMDSIISIRRLTNLREHAANSPRWSNINTLRGLNRLFALRIWLLWWLRWLQVDLDARFKSTSTRFDDFVFSIVELSKFHLLSFNLLFSPWRDVWIILIIRHFFIYQ